MTGIRVKRSTYVFAWIVWTVATLVIFKAALSALFTLADILDPVVPDSDFKTWSFYVVRVCATISAPVIAWSISYRLLFRQLNPVKMLGWMYLLGTLFTAVLCIGVITDPFRFQQPIYVVVRGLGLTMIAVMLMIRFLAYRAVRHTDNKTL